MAVARCNNRKLMEAALDLSKAPHQSLFSKALHSVLVPGLMAVGIVWTGFISAVGIAVHFLYPKWSYKVRWLWARVGLWLLGIRPHYVGLENLPAGGSILAPNHGSVWDILVMCLLPLKFKFIAKKQLSKAPILGQLLTLMGTYWVERTSTGRDLSVMRQVEDGLRNGVPVLIFPEGTRTKTGELLPFKKGAFRTALNSGTPLVPVAITGAYEIAPPGKLPTKWGNEIYVRIGQPFTPAPGSTMEQVSDEFRAKLVGLLEINRSRNVV